MPERQFIIRIPGVQVLEVLEKPTRLIIQGVALIQPDTACPRCQARQFRIKATRERQFKHGVWNRRPVWLKLRIPKLYCKLCSRYFMLSLPGILPKKRSTEQFRQEVFHLHQGGLTQAHLSQTHGISSSTIERWYHDFVEYRVKELEGRSCPIVLGIDEHFFSRKDGKALYATTFVDLRNHKVFDVVLGKYEKEGDLKAFLEKLPGREKVRVVVMDLCEHYRRLIKKYFPNAMIVTDRFHVVRWINHQFLNAWKQFDENGRKDRRVLSLMRRHEWNLKPEQREKLELYFLDHPEMRAVYDFKQGLMQLLLHKDVNQKKAQELIPQFLWHLNECLKSPIPAFQELGRTLRRWQDAIVRMWRFSKSNGITEGLHNKMELISRRAFGFRNFQNYRLRVIALCGWNGIFNRF
jgi:transposase